jgi:hypothetical protein
MGQGEDCAYQHEDCVDFMSQKGGLAESILVTYPDFTGFTDSGLT